MDSKLKSKSLKQLAADPDALDAKLLELKSRLAPKPFKTTFVDALNYIIRLEHKKQLDFSTAFKSSDLKWSQLDYALNELKKLCKQKHVILLLCNKMIIHKHLAEQTTANKEATKMIVSSDDEDSDLNTCLDRIELRTELDDLTLSNCDLFSLVKILIRFLFKLIKLNVADVDLVKFYNLKLVLVSCLADLCHYEEIKQQVKFNSCLNFDLNSIRIKKKAINDTNLKCLLKIFAVALKIELDSLNKPVQPVKKTLGEKQKLQLSDVIVSTANSAATRTTQVFYNVKRIWTKMCRLAANLCVDKNTVQVKRLFTNGKLLIC